MTHWAILVGVVYYGPHRIEDNKLKGCVADVEDMEAFLKTQISPKVSPANIFKLTSSHPTEGTEEPPEAPKERASGRNFISCLKRVIEHGEEGDNVYIHYSGHGSKGKGAEDVLLNFYASTKGVSQLPGEVVANLVKEMVNKKIHVTVAFDCCFSGATKRGSAHGLRFSNYIEPTEGSDDLSAPNAILENIEPIYSAFRNSQVIPHWITNPQGYTIFCACTPLQKAEEVVDETMKSCEIADPEHLPVAGRPNERGAFSFLLLRALKQLRQTGIAVTDGSLFEHLRARFHARIPNQSPVFYGSKRTSFFTDKSSFPSDKITAIFKKNGQFMLRKGSAHGVLLGDEYILFPLKDSAKASDRQLCTTS
ncbi:hypothetical protein LEMA_P093210.1 [Plenodomus lingam JN3]|uniref:Peptidase C14 caspase domain-containing protein n=1 Tax=Leptosphaeria maculans (strain JN3 / isolate v23.1.3 / race Av1-4-5-6-7-8) TaxID=985895 RepID=E5A2W6_LEPMJ|nr:hypothetical protein LEMA_P093210.1 [Plenodomus lingam JN3]CBX97912.1 hypothetical protein LEMA_P093210.1 [Plenodomus lingam JN3]